MVGDSANSGLNQSLGVPMPRNLHGMLSPRAYHAAAYEPESVDLSVPRSSYPSPPIYTLDLTPARLDLSSRHGHIGKRLSVASAVRSKYREDSFLHFRCCRSFASSIFKWKSFGCRRPRIVTRFAHKLRRLSFSVRIFSDPAFSNFPVSALRLALLLITFLLGRWQ